jgi:hypothetical protein
MDGLGELLENSELAGESVERVLDAIRFQTAVLALNAAVEAAHAAEAETARPRPARAPEPVPVLCRQHRPQPAPINPRNL